MPEPLRWQGTGDPRKRTFLRTAEAAALTRPPRREMPGFALETRVRESMSGNTGAEPVIFATAAPTLAGGPAVAPGRILDDHGKPGAWLEIPVADLCRHLLIAGMTGSGKSVTCEHLLLELWREHRVSWLAIKPGMKTGYRRLLNSEIGTELDVWAIGDPKSRRLSLNPLAVPPGVGLAEHTSALFTVIASAFELVAPMPEVLAAAIERTYRNHGWDLTGIVPDDIPPTLADLVNEIDSSASRLGYGPEITGNIRAGLLLRMRRLLEGPLAPELGSPSSLNIATLVKRPTIIELSSLSDAPSQALIMGLISLQLRHHWRLAGQSDSLRHVLLIEEAHRLLKSVPETAANASRTQAVESLATRTATFTWGLDLSGTLQGAGGVGGLLSHTTLSGGVTENPSFDGNGNIVAWTRSNEAAPFARREYDPFGNPLVSEGTAPCGFGFSTKMRDEETGLFYYGYRFYDPVTGRWPSRDPIGEAGGANLQAFTLNNPISSIDPIGNSVYLFEQDEKNPPDFKSVTDIVDSIRKNVLQKLASAKKSGVIEKCHFVWYDAAGKIEDMGKGSAASDKFEERVKNETYEYIPAGFHNSHSDLADFASKAVVKIKYPYDLAVYAHHVVSDGGSGDGFTVPYIDKSEKADDVDRSFNALKKSIGKLLHLRCDNKSMHGGDLYFPSKAMAIPHVPPADPCEFEFYALDFEVKDVPWKQ